MRRIESRRDRIFRVRLGTRDGDGVVGNEEGGDVGEGGVAVAEEVDEWEAELRGLDVERLFVGKGLEAEDLRTLKSGMRTPAV